MLHAPFLYDKKKIKKIAAYYNVSPGEAEDLLKRKGDNLSGSWSRPPMGVPLPTLSDFLAHNFTKKHYSSEPPSDNIVCQNSLHSYTNFNYSRAFPPLSHDVNVSQGSPSPLPPRENTTIKHNYYSSIQKNNNNNKKKDPQKDNSSHIFTSFTTTDNLEKISMEKKEADPNLKNNKTTTHNLLSPDENVEVDHLMSYSTLNPAPEILNLWISQCQNKFSSINKFIHRDVLMSKWVIIF